MKNGSSCDTYLGYALFVDAFFLKMIMILLTFLSQEVLLGRMAGAMGQGGNGRPEQVRSYHNVCHHDHHHLSWSRIMTFLLPFFLRGTFREL